MGGAPACQRPHLRVRGAGEPRLREPLSRGPLPVGSRVVRRSTRARQGSTAHDRGAAGPARRRALESAGWPGASRERRRHASPRNGARALRVAPAAPRDRRHALRLRPRTDDRRSGRARALRLRLRSPGAGVPRRRRLPHPATADVALSLRAGVLPRARRRARRDRARHRPPGARRRRDGVPRDHGSSRAPRPSVRRAVRAALGDGSRRHRRGVSGPPGGAAREPTEPRVGGGAEAAGAGGGPACYDERPHTAQIRGRRIQGVSENKTLNVGDPAPDFTLKTIGLTEVGLKEFRGKNVVILFYPLDWTPG
ncbi:MAG: hypothetical protein DMD96_30950 [Candidatus Rokuibacteriota bacterium]|nr:MAG: hypothetical protein DMD96_30950 [Candidatus Rokubacteria bacterium]